MTDAASLEVIWQALGRQERQIQETMRTLKARAKQLRADAQHAAADEIADAVVTLGLRLKEIDVALRKAEQAYFVAARTERRRS